MEKNYVNYFTANYVNFLKKTKLGDYSTGGSEYHILLDSYDELMRCVDNNMIEQAKLAKQKMTGAIDSIQKHLKKAWDRIFPFEEYPMQNSILGINMIIEMLLAEIKNINRS